MKKLFKRDRKFLIRDLCFVSPALIMVLSGLKPFSNLSALLLHNLPIGGVIYLALCLFPGILIFDHFNRKNGNDKREIKLFLLGYFILFPVWIYVAAMALCYLGKACLFSL
jgi:hypothetical protein